VSDRHPIFRHVKGGLRPEEVEGLVTNEAQTLAMDSDHAWFEAHPGAHVRYRDLIPGELPLPTLPGGLEEQMPPEAFRVKVTQLGPGLRLRQIVYGVLPGLESW
jgi:hypothetical protein